MAARASRPGAAPRSSAWQGAARRSTPQNVVQHQSQETEHLFLKTRLCKFFSVGVCSRGDACSFAHGQKELAPLPDLSRTQLCPSLLKTGHCFEGATCKFAHNKRELRPRPARTNKPPAPPPLAAEQPATPAAEEPAGEEVPDSWPGTPMFQPWPQPDGTQMMFTFMPMSPIMLPASPYNTEFSECRLFPDACLDDGYAVLMTPEPEEETSGPESQVGAGDAVFRSTEPEESRKLQAHPASRASAPGKVPADALASDGSTCVNSDCSDGEGECQVPVCVRNTFLEFGQPASNLRKVRSQPALDRP